MFNPAEALASLILSAYDRLNRPPAPPEEPPMSVFGRSPLGDARESGEPVAHGLHVTPDDGTTAVQDDGTAPTAVHPVAHVVSAHVVSSVSPAPAQLLYRCSHCNAEFPAYPVIDGPGYFQAVVDAMNAAPAVSAVPANVTLVTAPTGTSSPATSKAVSLQLARKHGCADGVTGLGFVVGLVPAVVGSP